MGSKIVVSSSETLVKETHSVSQLALNIQGNVEVRIHPVHM